jgi:hypothetical protein
MALNFTDAQITKLAVEGELYLASLVDFIVERVALPVTQGLVLYTLPDSVTDVRRVTYKGKKLDPFSGQEEIWSGSTPALTPQGLPKYYIYSHQGFPVIKVLPAPSEDLPVPLTGTPWDETYIENALVVEYVSAPNLGSSDVRVPVQLRRQFVKMFVLYRLFKREGKGMDPTAASYYKSKFEQVKLEAQICLNQVFSGVVYEMAPAATRPRMVGRPVLPPQFGDKVQL